MKFTFPEVLFIVAGSVLAAVSKSMPVAIILAALVWFAMISCEWLRKRR
jgi:hypothetical protein